MRELLPQNQHWLNQLAKKSYKHLVGGDLDPSQMYAMNLMWWALENTKARIYLPQEEFWEVEIDRMAWGMEEDQLEGHQLMLKACKGQRASLEKVSPQYLPQRLLNELREYLIETNQAGVLLE